MCSGNPTGSNNEKNDGIDVSKEQPIARPANMLAEASLPARIFFHWPYALLKLGVERPLEESDLPEILEEDSSKYNKNYFDCMWEREKQRNPKNPSLHRAIFWDFITSIWYVQPAMAAALTARVIQAMALGLLIEAFVNGNGEGYRWAGLLVFCGLVALFEHHHVFFVTWRKGMQYRISAIAAIYAKSLRLSSTHQETSASTGKIMNLVSNDVERFLQASLFISHIFWAPLQAIGVLLVGWHFMGPSFGVGFALLVFLFVPLQFHLSNRFAHFRSKIAAITDRRVTFVSQAVHGARVMKMSGYEGRFLKRIHDIRKEEVAQITSANQLKAMNEAVFFATNIVISLIIFLVHIFMGETLSPRQVFTVFALINVVQLEMTKHVSMGIMVRRSD